MDNTTLPRSDEAIDFHELFGRLRAGLLSTIGFSLLGMALAGWLYLAMVPLGVQTTSTRVVFSFSGLEKGEYPNGSAFDPEDLRAPEVIAEALKRQQLETTENLQNQIRAALSVEGVIPITITKERDRIRATGQSLRPFIADEYAVTLTLPTRFPIEARKRELLLNEIIAAYRDRFRKTYAELPANFGTALNFGAAFAAIRQADYFEYDLILSREAAEIKIFLSAMDNQAKHFRSQNTNLSFGDLAKQSEYFAMIRLNESLGIIRQNGLSKDRQTALVKMDYYLRSLADQERRAQDEEKLVQDLLSKAQERSENYVLGVKSQVAQQRTETPILDKGLIDSLLANDAYNFLVRRALDAGLKARLVAAEKNELAERKKNMEAFIQSASSDQSAGVAQLEKSIASLKTSYDDLVQSIRATYKDYAQQLFTDCVRISMQPKTEGIYRGLVMAALLGLALGFCAGIGSSLLRPPNTTKPNTA